MRGSSGVLGGAGGLGRTGHGGGVPWGVTCGVEVRLQVGDSGLKEVRELGLDIWESDVREGGGRVQGRVGLDGGFGNVPGFIFELINLVPVHSIRDDILRTRLIAAYGALGPLGIDDPVSGTLVTGRACTAGHHDGISKQIFADGTKKVGRQRHLGQDFHIFIIHHPGVLFYFSLTVGLLFVRSHDDQSLRIDFCPRNAFVRRNKEAPGDPRCFLYLMRMRTVCDPMILLASRALPVCWNC